MKLFKRLEKTVRIPEVLRRASLDERRQLVQAVRSVSRQPVRLCGRRFSFYKHEVNGDV